MMTLSKGNIFRVTGLLCGEYTGHRGNPRTQVSDPELWCFLWSASERNNSWVNKRHRVHYDAIVMQFCSYHNARFYVFLFNSCQTAPRKLESIGLSSKRIQQWMCKSVGNSVDTKRIIRRFKTQNYLILLKLIWKIFFQRTIVIRYSLCYWW